MFEGFYDLLAEFTIVLEISFLFREVGYSSTSRPVSGRQEQ
jgi:hypothetical protein